MNSIIEIGNMKYNVGGGCKKYHDFKNTFGHDSDTEYILRKYMIPKRPHFDPPSDKDKLITILQKRAQMLRHSNEFNNSSVKNKIFTQQLAKLEEDIRELRPVSPSCVSCVSPSRSPSHVSFKPSSIPFESYDHRMDLVLELAWILLHPRGNPNEIERSWKDHVNNRDTLHLDDAIKLLHKEDEDEDEDEDEEHMKKHVNKLIVVNEMNKFLHKMSDNTLDDHVNASMGSLYKHIKSTYPVYSLLEHSIQLKKPKIKSLLELLNICSTIRSKNMYGVYRFKTTLLPFIKHVLKSGKTGEMTLPNAQLSLNKPSKDSKAEIRLFVLGTNIESKEDIPFFDKKHLYIAYSNGDIPLNFYDINNDINNKIDFKHKLPFDKLFKVTTVFNDAELALAVFISFKIE